MPTRGLPNDNRPSRGGAGSYLDYFELVERPFGLTPSLQFFFATDSVEDGLQRLMAAVRAGQGVSLITGAPGAGKTTLLRKLADEIADETDCVLFPYSNLPFEEFLAFTVDKLGIDHRLSETGGKAAALREHARVQAARGNRVALLIDEAQNLSGDVLARLPELIATDSQARAEGPQFVLAGESVLDQRLKLSDFRPLSKLVQTRYALNPLSRAEVAHFIDFRLRTAGHAGPDLFDKRAIRKIADSSQGIPREINLICDRALFVAWQKGTEQVTVREVEEALSGFELGGADMASPMVRAESEDRSRREALDDVVPPDSISQLDAPETFDFSDEPFNDPASFEQPAPARPPGPAAFAPAPAEPQMAGADPGMAPQMHANRPVPPRGLRIEPMPGPGAYGRAGGRPVGRWTMAAVIALLLIGGATLVWLQPAVVATAWERIGTAAAVLATGPAPGAAADEPVAERVEALQREIAELSIRLEAVMGERDRLEVALAEAQKEPVAAVDAANAEALRAEIAELKSGRKADAAVAAEKIAALRQALLEANEKSAAGAESSEVVVLRQKLAEANNIIRANRLELDRANEIKGELKTAYEIIETNRRELEARYVEEALLRLERDDLRNRLDEALAELRAAENALAQGQPSGNATE